MAIAEAAAPPALAVDPTLGTCPLCTHEVLIVVVAGVFTALEPREILEAYPCPECEWRAGGRGWRRLTRCWRCFGLNYIGEPLPPCGVFVGPDGQARSFVEPERPRAGEAVYLEHVCG